MLDLFVPQCDIVEAEQRSWVSRDAERQAMVIMNRLINAVQVYREHDMSRVSSLEHVLQALPSFLCGHAEFRV